MLRLALVLSVVMLASVTARADPVARAFDLAAQGDWQGAASLVAPLGPVAQDLLEWQRLRSGEGTLTDYEAFLARRGDWPGLALLQTRAEPRVALSATPARVLRWFGDRDPVSPAGVAALARAMRAAGRGAEADAMIARVWVTIRLDQAGQDELLGFADTALDAKAHVARLDHLLWEGRAVEARLMLPLVGPDWRRLAEARLALREDRAGVDALVAAVPSALRGDPGLAHARFEWRARKGRTDGALEILRERSVSAAALGRPEAWADRRAGLARALLRQGNGRAAYEIAAAHHVPDGARAADLEFLAGFAALRFVRDPMLALPHFERLGALVSTPISVSRAEYWQGRALQDAKRTVEAEQAFRRAALHQTAYYGLLAAEVLGLALDPALATPPPLPDWRKGRFLESTVTEAALLLYRAGDRALARRFILHLAEGYGAQDLLDIGAFALAQGDVHLAVLIGKQAARNGIILPGVYFPDPGTLMPEGLPVDRALALAIARRESEFLPEAVSPAGALGLMQVMPGTAKLMADKLGLAHRPAALTTDPAFNARLGAAYLAHLAEEFGPSLALKAAGYNAGPGRPRAWIGQLGDPRRASVDVVDWVELVPFTETRTYIMRVAEGVAIYRGRTAPEQPVSITALLRGSTN